MKKILLGCFGLVMLLTSCNNEEFFELEQPPFTPWQSVDNYEMGVLLPYSMAFHHGWGGGFVNINNVIMDGMTDITYMIKGAAADYPHDEVYSRSTNFRNSRLNGSYGSAFSAINNINIALDYRYNPLNWVQKEEDHPFYSLSASEKNKLKILLGELYFMRALAYYNLCMMHAPAPGREGFETDNVLPFRAEWELDPADQRVPEMASASKIYDEIIKPDLDSAVALLSETALRDGRVNQYAAKLLAARVYFSLGATTTSNADHIKALSFLDDVSVSNTSASWGGYSLEEDPIKAWANSKDGISSKEVIWNALYYVELRNATPKDYTLCSWNKYDARQSDPDGTSWDLDEVLSQRCPWHLYCLSETAGKQVGWLTSSGQLNRTEAEKDKRFMQLYVPAFYYDTNSFLPDPNAIYETRYSQETDPVNIWIHKYFRGENGQYTNLPTMRLAEVVLLKAILEYTSGDPNEALTAINAVRNRAGLDALSGISGTDLEEAIENEWIKELAFEGHRLRYLLSLGREIPDADDGRTGTSPGDQLHWPIPLDEMDFQQQ